MEIYTAGFTKWSAAGFFGSLSRAGIERLVDVRLNNTSQLAGFSKRDDLAYFLRELVGADYVHQPLLAPTGDLLDAYKKGRMSWSDYEECFLNLLRTRAVEVEVDRALFEVPSVLLCSEHEPERCHRRLVADYLSEQWGPIDIVHMVR